MESQLEREEQILESEYTNGSISLSEYNKAMRDLQRDYAGAARESAQEAYERELSRW